MNIPKEKLEKYAALAHAMQTGVKLTHFRERQTSPTLDEWEMGQFKHLRVGVNMAMIETGAIGALLIAKGVITEEEYWDAILEKLQQEVTNYEQELGVKLG